MQCFWFCSVLKEILPGLFLGPYSAAMKSKVITVTRITGGLWVTPEITRLTPGTTVLSHARI